MTDTARAGQRIRELTRLRASRCRGFAPYSATNRSSDKQFDIKATSFRLTIAVRQRAHHHTELDRKPSGKAGRETGSLIFPFTRSVRSYGVFPAQAGYGGNLAFKSQMPPAASEQAFQGRRSTQFHAPLLVAIGRQV